MLILKLGSTFNSKEENIFENYVDMNQIVQPYAWHSFCIAINPKEGNMKLFHNNKIQLLQDFNMTHPTKKHSGKLLTRGHLGGPKFSGYFTDVQVFGIALEEENLLGWTKCASQVLSSFKEAVAKNLTYYLAYTAYAISSEKNASHS